MKFLVFPAILFLGLFLASTSTVLAAGAPAALEELIVSQAGRRLLDSTATGLVRGVLRHEGILGEAFRPGVGSLTDVELGEFARLMGTQQWNAFRTEFEGEYRKIYDALEASEPQKGAESRGDHENLAKLVASRRFRMGKRWNDMFPLDGAQHPREFIPESATSKGASRNQTLIDGPTFDAEAAIGEFGRPHSDPEDLLIGQEQTGDLFKSFRDCWKSNPETRMTEIVSQVAGAEFAHVVMVLESTRRSKVKAKDLPEDLLMTALEQGLLGAISSRQDSIFLQSFTFVTLKTAIRKGPQAIDRLVVSQVVTDPKDKAFYRPEIDNYNAAYDISQALITATVNQLIRGVSCIYPTAKWTGTLLAGATVLKATSNYGAGLMVMELKRRMAEQ